MQVNAQPYSEADWDWRLLVAHSFGHAAAAETVKGVLARLDADGVSGEIELREVREGRAEVVQMWGGRRASARSSAGAARCSGRRGAGPRRRPRPDACEQVW